MGAQKCISAGKGKVRIEVNFIQKPCCSHMLHSFSPHVSPFSLISGSFCMKQTNLFGRREILDIGWHKGPYDSNLMIAYRKIRPQHLGQRSLTLQFHLVGIHGIPIHNFSHSASGDVNLSQLSIRLDMNEPSNSNWSNTTSISFKHIHFTNNGGRSISRDLDGFPVTRSGYSCENMIVIKQESRFEEAIDDRFSHFSLQMEQVIAFLSNTTFNRFKFVVSKGVKLEPIFFSTWLTGGSIVGAMSPSQAFAIGGPSSVHGYGEGSIGSGQSCLVSKSELTIPLAKPSYSLFFQKKYIGRSCFSRLDLTWELVIGFLEIQHRGRANQEMAMELGMVFDSSPSWLTFKLNTTPSMPFNKEASILELEMQLCEG